MLQYILIWQFLFKSKCESKSSRWCGMKILHKFVTGKKLWYNDLKLLVPLKIISKLLWPFKYEIHCINYFNVRNMPIKLSYNSEYNNKHIYYLLLESNWKNVKY